MKKICSLFFLVLSLLLIGCTQKEVPAEITIYDENQEEIIYQIHKTDNPEEVKEVYHQLSKAKPQINFNGIAMKLESQVSGKVIVTATETSTIQVGYTIEASAESNFKKFLALGMIDMKGYTHTESPSLSLKTDNTLSLEFTNDADYAYLKGKIKNGSNELSLKNKIDITEFSQQYQASIRSIPDLLKYYNPINLLPDLEQWIEEYQISIADTEKESFTIRIHLPFNKLFEEYDIETMVDLDIKISCQSLLPIGFQMEGNQAISQILKDEYVQKYLTDAIQIQDPNLLISIQLEYGQYEINELSEEEKAEYKEYSLKKMLNFK